MCESALAAMGHWKAHTLAGQQIIKFNVRRCKNSSGTLYLAPRLTGVSRVGYPGTQVPKPGPGVHSIPRARYLNTQGTPGTLVPGVPGVLRYTGSGYF